MFHTNSLLIKLYLRFVRGDRSNNIQELSKYSVFYVQHVLHPFVAKCNLLNLESRNLQHLLFSKSNLEMITSKSSSTEQSPLSILTILSILCIISNSRLYTLEWILDSGMSGDVRLCNEGECGLRRSTPHIKIEDKLLAVSFLWAK